MNAREGMTPPRPRFVLTAVALTDRHAGLEWEPRPDETGITWDEAVARAGADGWRLPSAGELVTLLGGLPTDAGWAPPAGAVFWSSSSSPFAPVSRVRAVCCERGGRFAVVLLDKAAIARRWGVRAAGVNDVHGE